MYEAMSEFVEGVAGQKNLRPVWAVISSLKCPLVGACLTVSEQKRILKKAGLAVKPEITPYQIHEIVMSALSDKNRVSVKIDRFLRHKYRTVRTTLGHLDEEHLRDAWQAGLRTGDLAGVFYVVVSRPDVSRELLNEVFGEIHMMGHANMEQVLKARRCLDVELHVNQKLGGLINKERSKAKTLRQKNKKLASELAAKKSHLNRMMIKEGRLAEEREGDDNLIAENSKLKNKLKIQDLKLSRALNEAERVEREKRKLQIKMFELQSGNERFADEIQELIKQYSALVKLKNTCNESCPQFHLCAKRILIVGGMTKMERFYRDLVESGGGRFDYHDGYMNGAAKNLVERVLKSDLVICPVNCNSHGACTRIKNLCKKYNKPLKILPNSSLSAISRALLENNPDLN